MWISGGDWPFGIFCVFFAGGELPKFGAIGEFLKDHAGGFAANGRAQIGGVKGLLENVLDDAAVATGAYQKTAMER